MLTLSLRLHSKGCGGVRSNNTAARRERKLIHSATDSRSCDVLIDPEHVRGVVLSFDADEPIILLRECRTHERLHVFPDAREIEVWFAA